VGRRVGALQVFQYQRVGGQTNPKQVKRALEELIGRGEVRFEGRNRWRRYWAVA